MSNDSCLSLSLSRSFEFQNLKRQKFIGQFPPFFRKTNFVAVSKKRANNILQTIGMGHVPVSFDYQHCLSTGWGQQELRIGKIIRLAQSFDEFLIARLIALTILKKIEQKSSQGRKRKVRRMIVLRVYKRHAIRVVTLDKSHVLIFTVIV